MSNANFSMDVTDFTKKFREIALKTVPAAAEKGMFEAISELKRDADTVVPKTPHLEGNLRGDYTFILEGITQSKVEDHSGGMGSDHGGSGDAPTMRSGAKSIVAKIIFRMPYAAKWHEAVNRKINWSEKGSGPKYLETKLMMFKSKYMNIVASRVRDAAGK